jgi:hypothetical protein
MASRHEPAAQSEVADVQDAPVWPAEDRACSEMAAKLRAGAQIRSGVQKVED